MRHSLYIIVVLAAVWLLNSGHYTPLILGLGVLSIILVERISYLMDVADQEVPALRTVFRVFAYWPWLLKEIVLSNLKVVSQIWLHPSKIEPAVRTLKLSQKTDMGRVIYANSITLTPGTVSLDLGEESVTVHALNRSELEALVQGDMDQRVSRLEG